MTNAHAVPMLDSISGLITYMPLDIIGWSKNVAKRLTLDSDGQNVKIIEAELAELYEPASALHTLWIPPMIVRVLEKVCTRNSNAPIISPDTIDQLLQTCNEILAPFEMPELGEENLRNACLAQLQACDIEPEMLGLITGKYERAYDLSYWYSTVKETDLIETHQQAWQQLIHKLSGTNFSRNHQQQALPFDWELLAQVHPTKTSNRDYGTHRRARKAIVHRSFLLASSDLEDSQAQNADFHKRWNALIGLIVVSLLLFFGLRKAEIATLQWKDIDLDELSFTFVAKSHAGRDAARTLSISSFLSSLLTTYKKMRRHIRKKQVPHEMLFVFLGNQAIAIDSAWIESKLNSLARRAGFSNAPEAHSWRYLFYSFAMETLDSRQRRAVMGHQSEGLESDNSYVETLNFSVQHMEILFWHIVTQLNLNERITRHA